MNRTAPNRRIVARWTDPAPEAMTARDDYPHAALNARLGVTR